MKKRRIAATSNETVERIVDLVFQNTEMTDEIKALYDETLSNCQEHYHDMIFHGFSEDDAIPPSSRAIDQYPKKATSQIPNESKADTANSADEVESADTDVQTEYTLHPDLMKRIEMMLVCEDVHVDPSSDDDVHVILTDKNAARAFTCSIENGLLTVLRNEEAPKREHTSVSFDTAKKGSFPMMTRQSGKFKNSSITCRRIWTILHVRLYFDCHALRAKSWQAVL